MTFYIYNHNQSWVGADNANGRVKAKLWLSADIQKRSVGHKMQSYLLGFFYRYAFFIVCNEEAGVLLCTWFIRRRNKCLCFSQRLFAFPSLIKNGEAFAGVSVPTQSPSPSAGAGSGPCPFPRSRQRAVGSERAALRHPRQDTRGPCGALRFLPSFRGFPLAHCSAFPFWASRLHPAPKAQGSCDGKAQPALPRPCHVDNPRKRQGPGGSRRLPARPRRRPGPRERCFPGLVGHRDHATNRATAKLQLPTSFARRARGRLSEWGTGLAGARSLARRVSGPASARPRLAGPGPAPARRGLLAPHGARRNHSGRGGDSSARRGEGGGAAPAGGSGRGGGRGVRLSEGSCEQGAARSAARPQRQRRGSGPAASQGSGRGCRLPCRAPSAATAAASPGAPSGPGAGTPGRELCLIPPCWKRDRSQSGFFPGALPGAGRGGRSGGEGSSGSSLDLVTSNKFLTGEEDGVTIYGISAKSWWCLKGAALWLVIYSCQTALP